MKTLNDINVKALKKSAYDYYVLTWIRDHLPTGKFWAVMDEFTRSYFKNGAASSYAHAKDFVDKNGFDGEMWCSFEEFLANEYQDEEIMKAVLPAGLYDDYMVERNISTAAAKVLQKMEDYAIENEDFGNALLKGATEATAEPERYSFIVGRDMRSALESATTDSEYAMVEKTAKAICGVTVANITDILAKGASA